MKILKDAITCGALINFDHKTAIADYNMWLNGIVPFTKIEKTRYFFVPDNHKDLMEEERIKLEIIDKLVTQNEDMLYWFVTKVYNITIEYHFLKGDIDKNLATDIFIYTPKGKATKEEDFLRNTKKMGLPFRDPSHEKVLLTYFYNNQVHTTPYTKSMFINDPNVFS